MKNILLLLFLGTSLIHAQSTKDFHVHSHNDYTQNVPFWKAFAAGTTSIEADVFLISDSLYVGHELTEIDTGRTLGELYLKPLRKALNFGLGQDRPIQLLVDVKSEARATLDAIIKELEKYPSIITNENIKFIISGNRPDPKEYVDYPEYILFDYQSLESVSDPAIVDKIGLISLSFKNYSDWNGKGRLTAKDYEVVSSVIEKAHTFDKPFRFWATPDTKTAWKAFVNLGVDYVNTDRPIDCGDYLKTLLHREFQNTLFSEVYRPTFLSDGKKSKVKNIILLIGDGNGLAQISATALANKGVLSLTQLRSIGFLKTQSADDFTTDSAAGATAMATGHKTANRAIGTGIEGSSLPNITELLAEQGFVSGIVTTDEITGATPSAFYAHRTDRSMSKEIASDLFKSKISLFAGKKGSNFPTQILNTDSNFTRVGTSAEIGTSKADKIGFFYDPGVDQLATTTKNTLHFLGKKNKPFFLMVEGAHIDSFGHKNDIEGVITESISFDQAITEALKFADEHQNTLVIVTADHETGGLTIPQGNLELNEIEADFTTHDHTGTMVPIFAYGPQSGMFQGVYENNRLFYKMLKVLNASTK